MRGTHFSTTPLAVRPHNPRGRSIVVALGALIVATAVAGAYFYGEYRGGYERWIVKARHDRLVHERDALAKSNADLHQEIVFLKRSRKIDHAAQAKVQQSNSDLQAQIVELKKKLNFYNDIVAPGDVHSGLHIQALDVVATGKPRRYHYSLVLMQGPRHARETSGKATMTVVGEQDGKPLALNLAALQDNGAKAHRFKFRYFEDLRGDLLLPRGFKPQRIKVTVTRSGDDDPLTRTFDWRITG